MRKAKDKPAGDEMRTGSSAVRLMTVAAVILIFGGLWAAKESEQRTDQALRRQILQTAIRIAEAVDPDQAKALKFTDEDAGNPSYLRLCAQMQAYAQAIGLRSLYSMALRDGEFVFGPESLEPDDPYASAPGTVYENPTPEDFEMFKTGQANVQGPRTDEYGSFVSALAPVKDLRTGEVLMLIGIDIETPAWQAQVRQALMIPIEFTLLLLIILASGILAIRARQRFTTRHYPILVYIETLLCALLMLTATAIVSVFIHDAEKKARNEAFRALGQAETVAYADSFDHLRTQLSVLASFFKSSDHVSRLEFRAFCGPLLESRLIHACAWIPAVTTGVGEAHVPLLYVEPQEVHAQDLGYDLRAEVRHWRAVDEAMRTGYPTATEPVTLFEGTSSTPGFLICQPASLAKQQGVVALAILPDEIMHRENRRARNENISVAVSLLHLSPGRPPQWLSCSRKCAGPHIWESVHRDLHESIPVFAFGQTFSLMVFPEPGWLQAHPLRGGIFALITGLALTALLTTLVAMVSTRQAVLEQAILERSAKLVESEKRFSGLFRHLSAGFALHEMIYDAGGKPSDYRFLEVNPSFEQQTGLTARDIIGKTVMEVLPDTEKVWIERYGRVASTGQPEQFVMHAASLNKYYAVTAYCPEPGQFATVFDDVTGRRRTETEMASLQSIVTDSPAIAYRMRAAPGWPVEYVSANVSQLGYTPDDFYSGRMDITGLVDAGDLERVFAEMEAYCGDPGQTQFTQVYRVRTRDGRTRWVRDVTRICRDEAGHITHLQGVALDITEQHAAEEALATHRQHLEDLVQARTTELQTRADEAERLNHAMANLLADIQLTQKRLEKSRQELKMSNEAKSRFLAAMSHELHTPLNAIIGFSEAMEDGIYGNVDEAQTEPLENIRISAHQLHALINDLLDITRIEGDVMPVHAVPLPVRQVLEESVLLLQASARHRKQTLSADFRAVPDSLRIQADVVKIKQIMHHLISNAIKFTPEGGRIEARGSLMDGHEFGLTGQCLRVAVRDNGRGLAPGEDVRVFEHFYQADAPITRGHGGTGLGLAIAKEFVRLHGGRIWAESGGPGRGSIFSFVIPAEPRKPA